MIKHRRSVECDKIYTLQFTTFCPLKVQPMNFPPEPAFTFKVLQIKFAWCSQTKFLGAGASCGSSKKT